VSPPHRIAGNQKKVDRQAAEGKGRFPPGRQGTTLAEVLRSEVRQQAADPSGLIAGPINSHTVLTTTSAGRARLAERLAATERRHHRPATAASPPTTPAAAGEAQQDRRACSRVWSRVRARARRPHTNSFQASLNLTTPQPVRSRRATTRLARVHNTRREAPSGSGGSVRVSVNGRQRILRFNSPPARRNAGSCGAGRPPRSSLDRRGSGA